MAATRISNWIQFTFAVDCKFSQLSMRGESLANAVDARWKTLNEIFKHSRKYVERVHYSLMTFMPLAWHRKSETFFIFLRSFVLLTLLSMFTWKVLSSNITYGNEIKSYNIFDEWGEINKSRWNCHKYFSRIETTFSKKFPRLSFLRDVKIG
jgi:hypothetical protein